MIEYEELRLRLLESEKTVKNLKEALAIDTLKGDIAELEKESAKPDFWDDMENSQKVMHRRLQSMRMCHTCFAIACEKGRMKV